MNYREIMNDLGGGRRKYLSIIVRSTVVLYTPLGSGEEGPIAVKL